MPFRLDRFLTLYFFGPLARRFPAKNGIRIPILMYHSISDDPETGHPYFWINSSPAIFAQHMKFLHDNGYQVISLSTAVDLITGCRKAGSRTLDPRTSVLEPVSRTGNGELATGNKVVLTFDDGYRDFATRAFPVLKRYGFSATVFLPTAYLDDSKPGLKGKQHLGWKDVRKLQDEGVTFGSHTVNHLQMQDLNARQVEYEITKSKEFIEEETGRPLDSFCYPFKFPERDKAFIFSLKGILQKKGYKNAVCTRIGTAHSANDLYSLKRIPVNAGDGLPFFRTKLHGGYDWVYSAQLIAKLLKS